MYRVGLKVLGFKVLEGFTGRGSSQLIVMNL